MVSRIFEHTAMSPNGLFTKGPRTQVKPHLALTIKRWICRDLACEYVVRVYFVSLELFIVLCEYGEHVASIYALRKKAR